MISAICGSSATSPGDKSPNLQVGRVVKLQAAVTAIDGDGLEQIVQSRAAHLGESLARTPPAPDDR